MFCFFFVILVGRLRCFFFNVQFFFSIYSSAHCRHAIYKFDKHYKGPHALCYTSNVNSAKKKKFFCVFCSTPKKPVKIFFFFLKPATMCVQQSRNS